MNILLDTHICIWWLQGSNKLSKQAKEMIQEAECVYVSAVSLFEMAIKIELGKLKVDLARLCDELRQNHFLELPLQLEHTKRLATLPRHHDDPFDRLLIAQAISEPLAFLTADQSLENYSDLVKIV